jgi:hypothetical protein
MPSFWGAVGARNAPEGGHSDAAPAALVTPAPVAAFAKRSSTPGPPNSLMKYPFFVEEGLACAHGAHSAGMAWPHALAELLGDCLVRAGARSGTLGLSGLLAFTCSPVPRKFVQSEPLSNEGTALWARSGQAGARKPPNRRLSRALPRDISTSLLGSPPSPSQGLEGRGFKLQNWATAGHYSNRPFPTSQLHSACPTHRSLTWLLRCSPLKRAEGAPTLHTADVSGQGAQRWCGFRRSAT